VTGGPPDKLSPRHLLAATLEAAGIRRDEVAARVGMTYGRLSIVAMSPLYKAAVAAESDALRERIQSTHHEELTALWPKAIAAKHDLLNQRENLSVLNAASDSVLDRVLPRRRAGDEGGERVLHVRLSAETLDTMRRVLEEDPAPPAIDVTPPPDDAA